MSIPSVPPPSYEQSNSIPSQQSQQSSTMESLPPASPPMVRSSSGSWYPPGTTFQMMNDGSLRPIHPPPQQPAMYGSSNDGMVTVPMPPSMSPPYQYGPPPPHQQAPPQSHFYGRYGSNPPSSPHPMKGGRGSGGGGGGPRGPSYDEETGTYSSAAAMSIPGRLAFIRRVYLILTIQLAVTCGIILLFLLHDGIRNYVQSTPTVLYVAIGVSFVVIIALACCRGVAETFPLNLALLALFTLCQGYLLGAISSFYSTSIVIQAVAITAVITGALTLYAWTTTSDITKWGTFLGIGIIVLILGFLIRMFLPFSPIMDTIWACFGALLFSAYIVYDTFIIIHHLDPSQYVTACLKLYLDIINLFLFILQIIGGRPRR